MTSQCQSIGPQGKRCGLPQGHLFTHNNGYTTWENASVPTTPPTTSTKPEPTSTTTPKPTTATPASSPTQTLGIGATSPSALALTIDPQTVEEIMLNLERARNEIRDIDGSLLHTLRFLQGIRRRLQ